MTRYRQTRGPEPSYIGREIEISHVDNIPWHKDKRGEFIPAHFVAEKTGHFILQPDLERMYEVIND